MSDQQLPADKIGALECLLLMADRPLAAGELGDLLDVPPPAVRQMVEELRCGYRGITVREVAGGFELATQPEYAPYVARLHEPDRIRLSPAALEALAVVAYRQPVTRPDIESVRGVNSDGVVATLLDRGLIAERGHRQVPGRPMMYGTTDAFLRLFGLTSIETLPALANFMEPHAEALSGFVEED